MALTREDLQAIASLMDYKLNPTNERLDRMEQRFGHVEQSINEMNQSLMYVELKQNQIKRNLYDMSLDANSFEGDIRKDLHLLQYEHNMLITTLQNKGTIQAICRGL